MENYSFKGYRPPFEVRPCEDGNSSEIIDSHDDFVLLNVWNTHSGGDEQMQENQLIADRITEFLNAPVKSPYATALKLLRRAHGYVEDVSLYSEIQKFLEQTKPGQCDE